MCRVRIVLMILAASLCLVSAGFAADALLRDRPGTGIVLPTKTQAEQFGKRDMRNAAAPVVEFEVVVNDLLPQASWTTERVAVWVVPGLRVRPLWTTQFVAAEPQPVPAPASPAMRAVDSPVDGYCEITMPGDFEFYIVRGNAGDIGRRIAWAAGADYVTIAFEAR